MTIIEAILAVPALGIIGVALLLVAGIAILILCAPRRVK